MSDPAEETPPGKTPQIKQAESHLVHEEIKRLRGEEQKRRQSNHRASNFILSFLSILFISLVVSCLALHMIYPPEGTIWKPEDLVQFDSAGCLRQLSEGDIRWYLGREDTAALVAGWKDRSQRIDQLEDKIVRQALLEFQVRFGSAGTLSSNATKQVNDLAAMAHKGDFSNAAALFTRIVGGWTDDSRKFVGEKSIFDLNYGLEELARLKHQQTVSLSNILRPPLTHQIFWMSPKGALFEAVYWSLFGTLANLLVTIAQARARGQFRTDEFWNTFSKIIYGPILSFVLILAIYFGLLNPGTEIRFWFLPLAGFLFGYHTRRTANVLDKLVSKLLGEASKSAQQIGQIKAQAAYHAAEAIRAQARPKTFSELKQQALVVADTTTTAAVLKRQSEK